MKTKRLIWLYYGFQFFFSLLFWLPIFYEYQKNLGLTDVQILGIQGIYHIVFCLLEFPTGFLGDRFGYLLCLKLGSAALVIANILPILQPNYGGFLVHFLLIALARSMISGASSAYLYDSLADAGDAGAYKKTEGAARAYSLVGRVLGWAAVGYLMQVKLTLPYTLTAVSGAIALAFSFLMPNTLLKYQAVKKFAFGEVFHIMRATPMLTLVMLQGVAVFVLSRVFQVYLFQPLLMSKSFSLTSFGLIMSGMTIFEALGSAYPTSIRKWPGFKDDLNAGFMLTLIIAFGIAALSISGRGATLLWFAVISLATGLMFPIQRQLLNDMIPNSNYRATLLSIESIIDRGVNAAVALVLGGFIESGRLSEFLNIAAGATVLVVFLLYGAIRVLGVRRTA